MKVARSPIVPEDIDFLFTLYSEIRAHEMALVPWNVEQKGAFLRQQFQAQHDHYTSKYQNGKFQILKIEDTPIGRIYTADLEDEIRILDITISSSFRGKNIGTELINDVLCEAELKSKSVSIYLETDNRSANLFSRLGFVPVANDGVYQLWEKTANSKSNAAEA